MISQLIQDKNVFVITFLQNIDTNSFNFYVTGKKLEIDQPFK